MFTVLICNGHIIDDCKGRYYMYLKPFLLSDSFAFCQWNTEGESLDEAVPDLRGLIRGRSDWRAIIVNDSSTWGFEQIVKKNPFNYVNSVNRDYENMTFAQIMEARKEDEEQLEAAVLNPLMKLSAWLCGAPFKSKPELCYAGFEEAVEQCGEDGYIANEGLKDFIKAEIELDRLRLKRFEKTAAMFSKDSELFNPPSCVMAVAERCFDMSRSKVYDAWHSYTEFDYSQFCDANLYPSKLRYLLFDLSYVRETRNESQYFNFLSLLLTMATRGYPDEVFRLNRVYSATVEIDSECVRELCIRYSGRLLATLDRIDAVSYNLERRSKEPVDTKTAEKYTESGVRVPIETGEDYARGELFPAYSDIGLSGDCPVDEQSSWKGQYNRISKVFVRFLKEPRRAVRRAAKETFRRFNKIDDERALQLDELQKEEILEYMLNEETKMINSSTTHLFDAAEYKKKIDDANKEINRVISQRMTRLKTIVISAVALLAFIIGFFPLFESEYNASESVKTAFLITGAALVIFLLCGFLYLFKLRKRLLDRYIHFDKEMGAIVGSIEHSLEGFSDYLSHACNIMRSNCLLDYRKNSFKKRMQILKIHRARVEAKLKEIGELFSKYMGEVPDRRQRAAAYDFDYTVMANYEFELPYSGEMKEIVYMQEGIRERVPVDYLKKVSVVREDLYD